MKTARQWVKKYSSSGPFDLVNSCKEAEEIVKAIRAEAIEAMHHALFIVDPHPSPERERWVVVNGQEINPEHPIVRGLLHAMEQASKEQYFNAGHAINEAAQMSLKLLQERQKKVSDSQQSIHQRGNQLYSFNIKIQPD